MEWMGSCVECMGSYLRSSYHRVTAVQGVCIGRVLHGGDAGLSWRKAAARGNCMGCCQGGRGGCVELLHGVSSRVVA